jgi:hypothetical protein
MIYWKNPRVSLPLKSGNLCNSIPKNFGTADHTFLRNPRWLNHRFAGPELLALLADDSGAPVPLCETFFLTWLQVMASKFPPDQYCPNRRSCDTNYSFAGVWAVAPRARASGCRTREAIPKRMLTGEQPMASSVRARSAPVVKDYGVVLDL